MRYLVSIIIGLFIFISTGLSTQIGVIREFHGRRPALNRFRIDRKDLMDMNQNRSPDIVVRKDSILYVYDSKTKEKLWEYKLSSGILKFQGSDGTVPLDQLSLNYMAFVRWDDTDIVHVVLGIVDAADYLVWRIVIINTQTKEVEFNDTGRPIAVLQLPNGKSVILSYQTLSNAMRLIGVLVADKASYINNIDISQAHHSADFSLVLKFKSDPGLHLAYDPNLFDSQEDSDLDGDGYPDFLMLKADSGNVTGMVVRGGDSIRVIWHYDFPEEYKTVMLKGFHGFADLNGDGEKEAILGDNLAVTLDGTVHIIAENFEFLDMKDVDNDGYDDVIGLNTADSTIEVYGLQSATSVTDNDLEIVGFHLFQNYPNPFNPSTSISFSLEKAGDVKLTIYNELGQKVRILLNQYKPAGSYTLMWDGHNDAGNMLSSGQYFYNLRFGAASFSKKMILLK